MSSVTRLGAIALQMLGWSCLSVLLCVAAYWSVRLGAADRLSRRDSIRDARLSTELAPGNAHYLIHLAELELGEGRDASPALGQAVAASPLDSAAWVQLGLQAEQNGDIATAERALLRAAEVDRQFYPRWALAGFYVRRGDARRFWPWARQALEIAPRPDLVAVFRLCWSMSSQPEDIWRYAVPHTPVVLQDYLVFLVSAAELEAAAPVAAQLIEIAQKPQLPSLLWYCQIAILDKRTGQALQCWNRLIGRGLIPYPALDPARGKSLANENFEQPPLGMAFDWQPANAEGVSVERDESHPKPRIVFSGKQPEWCDTLTSWIVLEPRRKYRLAWRYETKGIPPGSGLKWQIYNDVDNAPIIADAPDLAHEGETEAATEFRTPEGFQLGRLTLTYHRALGSTRIEGSVLLVKVSLGFAP